MIDYNLVKPMRMWCHKILPLVYDESLSYYECLCKTVAKLNEVIHDINVIPNYIDDVIDEKLSEENIKRILREYVLDIESAISANNEYDNTNVSISYLKGQMLWWNDKLYRVTNNMPAGTTLIENVNVEVVTFEELFNSFVDEIKHDISSNDDGTNSTASQNWTTGDWLWLDDELYIVTKNIIQGNAYIFVGNNSNVKKITIEQMCEVVYYPNDKRLTLHAKISDYQQIVTAGDYHVYSPTREAIEIVRID